MRILTQQEAGDAAAVLVRTVAAAPIVEALYANGYVIADLEEGEVPPATIDLAQAARLLEGVSGLTEITSGELHTELVNMLMGVPEVAVAQVWQGITGNRMVVREVKDGRARLSYEDDPGDEAWEDVEDIRMAFTPATR